MSSNVSADNGDSVPLTPFQLDTTRKFNPHPGVKRLVGIIIRRYPDACCALIRHSPPDQIRIRQSILLMSRVQGSSADGARREDSRPARGLDFAPLPFQPLLVSSNNSIA
ncbi:hypothetical protein KC337_g71 [Hortaea werneckii]|nr:hypothetical protein KC337_g71 [Hortaea werneckii]